MIQFAVLALVGASLVPAEHAAGPGVKGMGVYPLLVPGLQAVPAGRPKLRLWCNGAKLHGVMVPEELQQKVVTTAQDRSLASAVLLRDGRCDADSGGISFGFLLPVKAWIFDTAARAAPEVRTTWLLHRFQGTVSERRLKGVLVQVDISHPGLPFLEARVEAAALGEEQASFADEKGWLDDVTRTFSVVRSEP
jgi:hypothetical protein